MNEEAKPPDYYEILGLSPNATDKEIRSAYKSACQKHHPDKSGADSDLFREIMKAYKVLSDPQRRAIYDQGLRQGISPEEFTSIMGALVEKLIKSILGTIEFQGGRGNFKSILNTCLQSERKELSKQKATLQSKHKLVLGQVKSVQKGQGSQMFKALLKKERELKVALENARVVEAVITFVEKDSEAILCKGETEEARLITSFLSTTTTSTSPWQS